jgi:hypothetical protein
MHPYTPLYQRHGDKKTSLRKSQENISLCMILSQFSVALIYPKSNHPESIDF